MTTNRYNNIRCNNCGSAFHYQAHFCPQCGKPTNEFISPKSNLVLFLLCCFLGKFGIHRIYAGKISSGIIQFLLCLIVIGYLWLIVDFIRILFAEFRDFDNKRISWTSK